MAYVRSSNSGKTWSHPRIIARDLWHPSPTVIRYALRSGNNLPACAIDPRNGHLYAVWQDGQFSGNRYDDIALSVSKDQGRHWSLPIRVNSNRRRDAVLPSISVNDRGTVAVTYYALQRHAAVPSGLGADYWLRTFSPTTMRFHKETDIAGPFDLSLAPLGSGHFVGDYEGLTSVGAHFDMLFVATNSDNPGGSAYVVEEQR